MTVFDFNSPVDFGHSSRAAAWKKGANVHGAHCVTAGLFAVGALGPFLVGSYEREGASFFTDVRTQTLQLALLRKAALCSNCF